MGTTKNRTKKQRVSSWVVTALFLLPMAGSGRPELLVGGPAGAAATVVHLGDPLCLMRLLGLAKILGAVAIVTDRSRTLTEWAYAGYAFDLLGALSSHLIVGDGAVAAAPGVMLALVLSSYRLYPLRVAGASEQACPPASLPLHHRTTTLSGIACTSHRSTLTSTG